MQETIGFLPMHVEIIDDSEGRGPAMTYPPGENYVDRRENPRAVEQISSARQHAPLRTFLAAVNGPESLFTSASVTTKCDLPAAVAGEAYEFASQISLVFADSSLNFDRDRYETLTSSLKELLERDSGDTVRTVLRIAPCDFIADKKRGYCLGIRLVAQGISPEQAEIRWGLGLARLQHALLFRARVLKQETVE
jgi:hypothetical protein